MPVDSRMKGSQSIHSHFAGFHGVKRGISKIDQDKRHDFRENN
jgi:hypothetical protein